MLKRRLHLQIYATIIASLVLLVVLSFAFVALFKPADIDDNIFEATGRLAWLALPPATASREEQAKGLLRMGRELDIELTLFDAQRRLIAANGKASRPPPRFRHRSGWQRMRSGPGWIFRLPDNRWIVANILDRRPNPLVPFLGFILALTAAIGLGSYPFVRKLTRRLENLKAGVEEMGQGNLGARVEVKGRDEVASLATSFNETARTIERLVTANRQLLANASHELRTPLSRVRLGVELMETDPSDARRDALRQDIAELDELIDEILLMSRLDNDAKPDLSHPVDLLALAAEECARYDDCTLDGAPVEINGNEKLLRRLVRNLLDNANKHGRPPITMSLKRKRGAIELRVRDEGPGIEPNQRSEIFEPFYRAPGKQNVKGFGLGLALVRQIAETHGGTVELGNTSVEGTEFVVTFEAGEAAGQS
ncbi:MAG: HAMP domain-containing sensor histidine kinase [Pseudomonadota bacterium]